MANDGWGMIINIDKCLGDLPGAGEAPAGRQEGRAREI